ncbi:MAG: hypothetical protein KDD38_04695 [Bdellovibrionales bacterium]|nr:hypothetical protein [Bdellovibrionales bacterium]
MSFNREARELDLAALVRFARQNCLGVQKSDSATQVRINYCELSDLATEYQSLRNIIGSQIGKTINLKPNWTLSDILSAAFSVRFEFSERDVVQDLLDFAVLRAALFQKVDVLTKVYDANSDYLNGNVCYFPRLKAALSGESLLYQHWNFAKLQTCHKRPDKEDILTLSNEMSCSANRSSWLNTIKVTMQAGSIQKAISINNEAELVTGRAELAQIEAFVVAYKLSAAYAGVVNTTLDARKVLDWRNSADRCGSIITDDPTVQAFEKFCFELYQAEVTPFDITDDERLKLALFAVISTEMKTLQEQVNQYKIEVNSISLEQQNKFEAAGRLLIREVGEILSFFLDVHQRSFNPGLGE